MRHGCMLPAEAAYYTITVRTTETAGKHLQTAHWSYSGRVSAPILTLVLVSVQPRPQKIV